MVDDVALEKVFGVEANELESNVGLGTEKFLEMKEGLVGNIGPPLVAESVDEDHSYILLELQ